MQDESMNYEQWTCDTTFVYCCKSGNVHATLIFTLFALNLFGAK